MITKENGYYSVEAPDNFSVIIGDEGEPSFVPKLKINKWNGNCKFSMELENGGTITKETDEEIEFTVNGKKVKFKPHKKEKNKDDIDILDLGAVDPKIVPAEYEMADFVKIEKVTVVYYYPNTPSIYLFGTQTADKYLDLELVDIPMVRASSHSTNPSYGDSGIVIVDIHVPDDDDMVEVITQWNQAIIDVFDDNSITIYESNGKLYYEYDSVEYKLSSPEPRWNNIWSYINIECDYTKIFDYYSEPASGEPSPGVKTHYPAIDKWIVEDVIDRFAVLMGENTEERVLEQDEIDLLNARADYLYPNDDWVLDAERDDVRFIDENIDRFNFDMEFDEKPDNNILTLDLVTENLVFYKQPELTAQDKDDGCYRAPNVVGSYAVYYSNRKEAYTDTDEANLYGIGKAFHIYRPALIDKDDKKVWCDIDINTQTNTLTVTMPQAFLDSAKYPVTLDPTFGYTSIGASAINPGNLMLALYAKSVGKSGYATKIYAYCTDYGIGSPQNSKCALYNNTAGNVFLEETNIVGFGGTGWKEYTLNSTTLVPSQEIAIVLLTQTQQYQKGFNFDVGTSGSGGQQSRGLAEGFPDPHTMEDTVRIHSIYVTYEYAGAFQVKGTNIDVKGVDLQVKG